MKLKEKEFIDRALEFAKLKEGSKLFMEPRKIILGLIDIIEKGEYEEADKKNVGLF
jgi:hypothetical protein